MNTLSEKIKEKYPIQTPIGVVQQRKENAKKEMEKEINPSKKAILNRIYERIYPDGEYSYCLNVFDSYDNLSKDKEFVIRCIKLHPEVYEQIDNKLKPDKEVIMTLARTPIFYNSSSEEDYGSYAHCPLWYILYEYGKEISARTHAIHYLYLDENEEKYSIEELAAHIEEIRNSSRRKNWKQLDERINEFLEKKDIPLEKYITQKITQEGKKISRINDREIILAGLRAELDSYEYCKMMEKNANIISYQGLEILTNIIQGNDYDIRGLDSLSYASKELLDDESFMTEVKEIIEQWKSKYISNKKSIQSETSIDNSEHNGEGTVR